MATLKEDMKLLIKEYNERYPGFVPCVGFMAGWFKVTPQWIRNSLKVLEKEGFIKRKKADVNFTSYKVL